MKKKLFLKFFVLAVIGAFVTFTSCKDYDDDINKLQNEVNSLKTEMSTKIDAAKSELSATLTAEISKVTSDLAAAKADLATTKAAVAAAETKLAAVEKQAGDNAAAIEAAQKALDKAVADLQDAKDEIVSLAARLDVLETFKTETLTEISSLKAQLVALETALGHKASKEELAEAVATLNGELTKLNDELTALKAEAATKEELAAAVEVLEGKIDQVQANLDLAVAGLEGRLNDIEANYAKKQELADALAALKGEITEEIGKVQASLDKLGLEVKAIDDAFKAFLGDFEGNVQDILDEIAKVDSELSLRISTLEALLGLEDGTLTVLDGLAEELDTQFGLISKNTRDINALIGQLADQKAELETLIGKVKSELKGDIDVLDGKITANANAITALGTTLREEIAAEVEALNETIDALDKELSGMIDGVLKIVTNRLTSIALAPNLYVDGIEAIKFTTLTYADCDNPNRSKSIGAPAYANYKFNPRTFKLANADFSYSDRVAEVITRAGGSSLVAIEGVRNAADGTVEFTLRRLNAHNTQQTGSKENFIQLEATLKGAAIAEGEEGVVIAAEQELVYDETITPSDIKIGDIKSACGTNFKAYAESFAAAQATIVYDMEYNKVFDLGSKVKACFGATGYDIEDFNLSFRYSLPDEYNITEGQTVTNQQKYFELLDAKAGTYKAIDFSKEAIGRTPIFKVELVDADGCVVKTAHVKVEVSVAKSEDLVVNQTKDIVFKCDETKVNDFVFDEEFIRANVYRVISATTGEVSMSHEEFWNTYNWENPVVSIYKNSPNNSWSMPEPEIVSGSASQGTATKKVVWNFEHGDLGTIGAGGSTFVATLTVENKLVSSAYPEFVTFQFTLNVKLPSQTLVKVENESYWTIIDDVYVEFNSNINVPDTPQDDATNALFSTDLFNAYTTLEAEFPVGTCVTRYVKVINTYSNGIRDVTSTGAPAPLAGVQINGSIISLAKNNAPVENALNSPKGLKAQIALIYVLESGDEITVHDFMVNFIRPVNLNLPVGKSLQDAKTGGDVLDFNSNNLLTDWFGNAIIDEVVLNTEECSGAWVYSPLSTPTWVPGYDKLVTPAKLDVEYDSKTIVLAVQTQFYRATQQMRLTHYHYDPADPAAGDTGWVLDLNYYTFQSDWMLSQADASLDLDAKILAFNVPEWTSTDHYHFEYYGSATFEEDMKPANQEVTYTYITKFEYTQAVYDWVDGYWEDVIENIPAPVFAGTSDGQREGNHVWEITCTPATDVIAGQYWNFYQIGSVSVDIAGITTNRSDKKLPSGATVVQEGNTIKYVNIGNPVTNSFLMYVPVTLNYGWGSLTQIMTVQVIPSF